jgi:hypothetical protein
MPKGSLRRMRQIMRKIMMTLALIVSVAGMVRADTIYLKNGSSMQGKCIGFEDSYFVFELSNGNQAKYLARDVSRLVIEDRTASDDTRYRRSPRRDRDNEPSSPGGARWESAPPIDVRLQDQWIRSQVQVHRGQRVRVEATGSVTLEGRYVVSPDGQPNSRASDLPMPNQNDGGLIAVVGRDEDAPQIFIGRQREFVADRDGILYFTVNHWEIRNSSGAFRVIVSVDRSSGGWFGGSRGSMQRREKVVTVPGNQTWVDTGIDLNSEVTLDITAEGQITFRKNQLVGPDGELRYNNKDVKYPINSSGVGALIAKVRYANGAESAPRFIGAHNVKRIGPSEYGRLFLGINDNGVNDNTGSFTVTIRW